MLCRRYFNSVFAMMVNKIAYSKPKTSCTEAPLLRVDWYAWTIKLTSIIDNCNSINWNFEKCALWQKISKANYFVSFLPKYSTIVAASAELGNIFASFLEAERALVIYFWYFLIFNCKKRENSLNKWQLHEI